MKLKIRLLSLFLCFCLLLTLIPHTAPKAEAASLAGMLGNLLLSRGTLAAVTGISAIGKYTGDTETAALINKWVFGVIDTVTPGLEAAKELSRQMTALHNEVMAELDFIEQKLDSNLSGIEKALASVAANDAYDNYLSAWNADVTGPLSDNGYHHVVNAYKNYLEYAGSYMNGTKVTIGNVELIATRENVEDCRDSFRAALERFSGYDYDTSAGFKDSAAYYDHILYETNAVDQKAVSTINTLIGRMINAYGDPAGGRYLDRAAQVAYAYFPYSEDQAAFVDAAIMKQSHELNMALLAYQEFIGMRKEYCESKLKELEASGASDAELDALRIKLNECSEPNKNILDLIYGGRACDHIGGATTALNTWLSDPIYISNSNSSYLYLEDYIRATDTDRVTLTNSNFAEQSDFDTILAESKEGKNASIIDTMINIAMIERDIVEAQAVSSADTITNQVEFIRRGVVIANLHGRATVKPVYLLADSTEDKSARLMRNLNWEKTIQDLALTPLMGYHFTVPHADYYNLRDGIYSDGYNDLSMVSADELQALVDNIPLATRKSILRNYFADVLGEYPEGRDLVMLTSDGTTSGNAENMYYTEYKGIDMLNATSFITENVTHDALENTSYTVMLAGGDVTYGKLTAESDSLMVSLSGEGYDAQTGKTAAASAVTLTVTPTGCGKITRITAQYHEEPGNPYKVTYTDILVDENTADSLSCNDDGSVELVYYMPYTNVTLVVEGQSGHPFSDAGFCPVCGAYEPAVHTENGHMISNAGQLYWFSAAIRGDMTHISSEDLPTLDAEQTMAALFGTIIAPIDLSVADDAWVPIGTAEVPYLGCFDGGNQPITNLNGPLFGQAQNVTLRNIAIESGTFGPTDQEQEYIGSIAGRLNGYSNMIHCYSKAICTGSATRAAGGLAGNVNNGFIQDCYFAGSLRNASNCYVGGLVGNCGVVDVENCSVVASVGEVKSGGLIAEVASSATITNSYFDSSLSGAPSACYSNTNLAPEASKSSEAYESGEVAYLLNAESENAVWYQTIGKQKYPEFTGQKVYYVESKNGYSNYPDGICPHPEENLSQSITSSLGTHTIYTSCFCGEYSTSVTEDCVDRNIDNYCDVCGEEMPAAYGVDSWNLSLHGDIRVNFLLNLASTAATVEITVDGEPFLFNASDLSKEDKLYKATVGVAATQMTQPITVKILEGEETMFTETYTVRQYCDTILADESYSRYHILIKEMLNYGGAAQVYFDYDAENPANDGITDVAATEIPETAEKMVINDKVSNVNFYGASLVYRDRIAVRFYFTGDITGCTFTDANGNAYSATAKSDKYYIEIANILPQDLAQMITLTVTDAGGNALTVTYSPMNYIVRMSTKDSDNLKVLLKALYNYHLAAKTYSTDA